MAIGKNFVRAELGNSVATLYTVPVGTTACDIRTITVVNRSESKRLKWWLYLVPSGDSAADSNVLIPGTDQWDVPPGKNLDYDTWKVLSAGDTIQGYCDGEATIHIDGAERS